MTGQKSTNAPGHAISPETQALIDHLAAGEHRAAPAVARLCAAGFVDLLMGWIEEETKTPENCCVAGEALSLLVKNFREDLEATLAIEEEARAAEGRPLS